MSICKSYTLLTLCAALLCTFSCVSESLDEPGKLPEGECVLDLRAYFREMSSSETKSVSGDAIGNIENLFVAWFSQDGSPVGCKYLTASELTLTDVQRPGSLTEISTKRADFQCTIPYGYYRIYAAANMGDLSSSLSTESAFRSMSVQWNASDVPSNSQMAGCFTIGQSDAPGSGQAPLLSIVRPGMTLHAWLRRLASKVTVAYDASALNDNIYIYIASARIKDIPSACSLVDDNSPSSAVSLIHDGDVLDYTGGSADKYQWSVQLANGRDACHAGDHSEDAQSLFFYENMQGTHPDKHLYRNFDSKDNVPYGSYVEVTGYYINKSADKPSSGNIIYRYMLGKNDTDDFNAQRNTHYKLTLKFKNDANDPDWHIEYDFNPRPPEIVVPSPLYISYLANQSLDVPVTVYYDKDRMSVTSLSAEIVRNEWFYEGHPYQSVQTSIQNGFLSLQHTDQVAVDIEDGSTMVTNRSYTTPDSHDDEKYHFTVPVYTRPLTLFRHGTTLASGFSGQNDFAGKRRYSTVRFTAHLSNGETVTKDVEIIQVHRIHNPTGIWRSANVDTPFRVTVEYSDGDPNVSTSYNDLISMGPWTARIKSGADWVRIKDTESDTWGTDPVTGGTMSVVEFDYKPAGTTVQPRFGIIEVTFHDNKVPHEILVSQGLGTVDFEGTQWQMTNVLTCGVETANPLLEGSMFAFGGGTGLKSSNNTREGYGFDIPCIDINTPANTKYFDVYNSAGTSMSVKLTDVVAHKTGFAALTNASGTPLMNAGGSHVATYEDWERLTHSNYYRYYGVLYGDECTETLKDTHATSYLNVGDHAGMRGCFVVNTDTGRHMFLPISNTGFGRRKYLDNNNVNGHAVGYGVLKYAQRTYEMPVATANILPMFYDLWKQFGAQYWYNVKHGTADYRFDINYFSYDFQNVASDNNLFSTVGSNDYSDWCFVRRVRD